MTKKHLYPLVLLLAILVAILVFVRPSVMVSTGLVLLGFLVLLVALMLSYRGGPGGPTS